MFVWDAIYTSFLYLRKIQPCELLSIERKFKMKIVAGQYLASFEVFMSSSVRKISKMFAEIKRSANNGDFAALAYLARGLVNLSNSVVSHIESYIA